MRPELWTSALQRIKAISGRKIDDEDAELMYGELRDLEDGLFETALHRYLRLEPLPRNLVMYFTKTCCEIRREDRKHQERQFESGVQSGEVTLNQHAAFWRIVKLAPEVYTTPAEYETWHEGFAGNWNNLNSYYLAEYLSREEKRLGELRCPQGSVLKPVESTQSSMGVIQAGDVPF